MLAANREYPVAAMALLSDDQAVAGHPAKLRRDQPVLRGAPNDWACEWADGRSARTERACVCAGLTSVDGFLILPGVGLLGLFALIVLACQHGAQGALGRFGLTAGALLLSVYSPYFYQSLRFVLPIVPFLAIGASWSLMHSGIGVARRAGQLPLRTQLCTRPDKHYLTPYCGPLRKFRNLASRRSSSRRHAHWYR